MTWLIFLICAILLFFAFYKQNILNEPLNGRVNGSDIDDIDYSYVTYDGNYKIKSKNTYFPKNLDDIQNIVKNNPDRKIRASGGSHTFNDISLSDDIIVRTINLNKVLSLNKTLKQVTVEAGSTLLKLSKYLEKNNLSLPMFPAIPFQTVGGVVSTGTHGSRQDKGSFSSIVVDITMVLSNGSIKKFNKLDKEFNAVTASLGSLGIIYSVTLQCEDLYYIEHIRKVVDTSDFLKNIDKYKNSYNFFQAYMKPKKTVIYLRKKTKNRKIVNTKNLKRDVSYKILTKTKNLKLYTEIEIGIPQESTDEAVKYVLDLINKYKEEYNYNYKRSVLIRFTNKDNSLISVPSNRKTVWINLFKSQEDDTGYQMFKEYENYMIDNFNGRPHYGKFHFLNENKMKKIYGKKSINSFNSIKQKLDPKKMFSNSYILRLFGN